MYVHDDHKKIGCTSSERVAAMRPKARSGAKCRMRLTTTSVAADRVRVDARRISKRSPPKCVHSAPQSTCARRLTAVNGVK
ncbi:MAG: hypothetical protein DMF58_08865 [Acidobacteria bacterium]|nr:MAG: hypothetical protein DMF58_08865 [Acidobacteriota bacterium]